MDGSHTDTTITEEGRSRASRQRDVRLGLLMLFSILGLSLGGALLLLLLGR